MHGFWVIQNRQRVWCDQQDLVCQLLFRVWSLDQQHQYHQGTGLKCKFLNHTPTYRVRNLGLGLAVSFWCTVKFDNYCLRVNGNPTQKCPQWYIFPSGMSAASGWPSQGEQEATSPLALIGGNSVMPFRFHNSPLGSGWGWNWIKPVSLLKFFLPFSVTAWPKVVLLVELYFPKKRYWSSKPQ